jgi:uncharacterized protein (TIGR02996 family)
MRKFKFVDDESYKFWNIELAGTGYTTTWGKIGTKGQSKSKDFGTNEAAQKAYDKIIKEKLAEGYVEITPPAPLATTENVLEKAIAHDFDDVAAHAAYADWLTQQGDPRGELIQVQLALEDAETPAAQRKELQKREAELLKTHGRTWLGALAGEILDQEVSPWLKQRVGDEQYRLNRGWLETLRLPSVSVKFARTLAKTPESRFLQRLYLHGQTYEEAGEFEPGDDIPAGTDNPAMYALLRCPYFTHLRVLFLGEPEAEGNCHTSGETAVDLVTRMPNLEELYLLAHRVDMKTLFAMKTLPKLRILQIDHNRNYPLEILAENSAYSNLTHLMFYPHALEPDDDAAYINLDGVRALVHSPHLKKLTHLRLRLSDLGDEGCEEIVRSGILKNLKMLDLMHGRVSDEGAKLLAACKDIRNLELLEISNNRLTKEGIDLLKKAGIVKVKAADQYDPNSSDDEMEYLWMGDME